MNNWDLVFSGFNTMTMDGEHGPYGLIDDGAVAISDGKIAWIGKDVELASIPHDAKKIIGNGKLLTPGLIDCHTHLVYGGNRADEWEQRIAGVSYEKIARAGGGILSTVNATRRASESQLYDSAARRLGYLMQQGVTTVEIKSGYGLDLESELKMLRIATQLAETKPVNVSRTLLAAHCVPPEFKGQADKYITFVCDEVIPQAIGLCEAVDVFCESIAFDLEQTRKVFETALKYGLGIKVHAEQLSRIGGAALCAEMGGWSADHLEYLSESDAAKMGRRQTVAVLLPGAFYFLNESTKPPIEAMRNNKVPIAVATDANPGSSPVSSLLLMMNMACTLFGLTVEEALKGTTVNAAKALRLNEQIGSIEVGKNADLAIWDIASPAELVYRIGENPCIAVYKDGKLTDGGNKSISANLNTVQRN